MIELFVHTHLHAMVKNIYMHLNVELHVFLKSFAANIWYRLTYIWIGQICCNQLYAVNYLINKEYYSIISGTCETVPLWWQAPKSLWEMHTCILCTNTTLILINPIKEKKIWAFSVILTFDILLPDKPTQVRCEVLEGHNGSKVRMAEKAYTTRAWDPLKFL